MNKTMGLYRVAGTRLIRMRRANRHNASWTHVTTDGPDTLRAPALCRSDSNGGPWYWTDDNISCSACLHVIRAGLADGSFILATPAQVAAMRRETRREQDASYGERDYDDLSPEWTL